MLFFLIFKYIKIYLVKTIQVCKALNIFTCKLLHTYNFHTNNFIFAFIIRYLDNSNITVPMFVIVVYNFNLHSAATDVKKITLITVYSM